MHALTSGGVEWGVQATPDLFVRDRAKDGVRAWLERLRGAPVASPLHKEPLAQY